MALDSPDKTRQWSSWVYFLLEHEPALALLLSVNGFCWRISVALLLSIGRRSIGLWLGSRRLERLLKVGNDIVDVLSANRDSNEILPRSKYIAFPHFNKHIPQSHHC